MLYPELFSTSFEPGVAMSDVYNVTQFTDCLILRDHKLAKEDLWIANG